MSDNLFDFLDDCITRMDAGEDIESCLARYPQYASELRPLLLAAMEASSVAVKDEIPPEVLRRGKLRVLKAADEIREQQARKPFPIFNWQRSLRTAMTVLAVFVLAFAITGTGLVYASNATLPGDNLYTVKRTWEDLRLQLAFNPQERKSLEDTYEQERIQEVSGLVQSRRMANVEFSGIVNGIFPDQIIVSGLQVFITGDTKIDGSVQLGSWVKVDGQTESNGSVIASEIKVISSSGNEDTPSNATNNGSQNEDNQSGPSGKTETPEVEKIKTPEPEKTEKSGSDQSGESGSDRQSFELQGVVTSANGNQVVIDGKTITISSDTEMNGQLNVGTSVRIKGYLDENGKFIALRIENNGDSGSGNSGSGGDGNNGGSNGGDATRTPKPGGGDSGGSGSDHTPNPTDDHSGSGGGGD
jgi:uncharacterized membrane protein YgcG